MSVWTRCETTVHNHLLRMLMVKVSLRLSEEDGSILPEDKVLWPNSFVLLHNLYPVLF